MASEIHDISMLLGQIQGTLQALDRKVDDGERRASDSRTQIQRHLEEQDDAMQAIVVSATQTQDEVRFMRDTLINDVKPVTDDVKRWRLMGVGAIGITGIGAAWLTANFSWLIDVITSWFKTKI